MLQVDNKAVEGYDRGMSELSVRAALDALVFARPFLLEHGGLFSKDTTVSIENMSPPQVDELLRWLQENGARVLKSRDYHKNGRSKRNSYYYERFKAEAKGVVVHLYCEQHELRKIHRPRVSSMDKFCIAVFSRMIDEDNWEKVKAAKARGVKYFYADGSLLKRAVELLGEPVEEGKP